MKKIRHHDSFLSEEEVKVGSERSFGIVFAIIFGLIAIFPLFGGRELNIWVTLVAVLFLLVAIIKPDLLAPLNRLWFKFGMLLHMIVNPLVMGVIFFGVVTPTALLFKLFGKDPLRLRWSKTDTSYWILRDPPGPEPESLRRQF